SRRRHTRSDRDWSSDVCSSDLVLSVQRMSFWSTRQADESRNPQGFPGSTPKKGAITPVSAATSRSVCLSGLRGRISENGTAAQRSEERRVGKECRCGEAAGDEK